VVVEPVPPSPRSLRQLLSSRFGCVQQNAKRQFAAPQIPIFQPGRGHPRQCLGGPRKHRLRNPDRPTHHHPAANVPHLPPHPAIRAALRHPTSHQIPSSHSHLDHGLAPRRRRRVALNARHVAFRLRGPLHNAASFPLHDPFACEGRQHRPQRRPRLGASRHPGISSRLAQWWHLRLLLFPRPRIQNRPPSSPSPTPLILWTNWALAFFSAQPSPPVSSEAPFALLQRAIAFLDANVDFPGFALLYRQ